MKAQYFSLSTFAHLCALFRPAAHFTGCRWACMGPSRTQDGLEILPVISPETAVKVAIVSESKVG